VVTLIAVGGSQWPRVSQFDLFPLLGILVTLLIVRFALRLALTIPTIILAIVAGTGWAWSVERWGWPPTTLAALWLTFAVATLTSRPRPARRRGGTG
jgi:hypothetical protein